MVAAHELMKLGLRPVVYEAGRIGGRLRSEPFGDDPEIVAELGGMRFPRSASTFYHYTERLGLETRPVPEPADRGGRHHGDRSGRRAAAGTHHRRPAGRVPGDVRRLGGGARERCTGERHPPGDAGGATPMRSSRCGTRSCTPGTTEPSTTSSRRRPRSPASASRTARCSARSASAPAAGTRISGTPCSRSCAWC